MNPIRVGKLWWIIIVLWLSCCVVAQAGQADPAAQAGQAPPAPQSDQGDPPGRVARISFVSGKVSLEPAGVSTWSAATLNYPMTTNDRIYTDQEARAELDVGSSAVRLAQATDLTVANLSDQFMQLGLAQGTIRVSVYRVPAGNSVEIDTPNGALTVRQQGYYRVETYPDENATLVSVYQGAVELSGANLSGTVGGGQAVKLTGSGPIDMAYVSLPGQDDFDRWSSGRDSQFVRAASLRYVSPETPGYASLDGYGVWSEVPPYGPVWYPTAVPVGWVPYRFGHWVWVGPWGWTWVGDEPWAFAPFHYGRWLSYGGRWGWVPGPVVVRPYYAPALVAFVGGSGFSLSIGAGIGFAAWFPLGPREPFYPWYHSGPAYLRQVNVTNIRNVTNITNIVNVRNVSNIRYVNRNVATTVVRQNVFSSGESVRNGLVRVNATQLARAPVIPHPMINPARSAVMAGRSVAAPVRTERFTARVAPQRQAVPAAPREAPLSTAPQRAYQQPAGGVASTYHPAQNGMPPSGRPQLFTHRSPAPPSLPFATKEPAMEQHPGRPLEPQQVQNLRQGRPAGPMRDREYIPHPSQQPSRPSRPERSEAKSPGRRH